MTEVTKQIGTSVISTIGIALKISSDRFGELLKLAQEAVNYQPVENKDQEKMAAEWNAYIAKLTENLTPHEAVVVGAVIALYLHEGILEQNGAEDIECNEDGEVIYEPSGAEGWLTDSYRDVV